MISHVYRCIFIHIPRCAGSSIETWICGKDWWDVDPPTKHLTAAQARRAYGQWWDDYFKFSVVRDPYTRTLSLLKFCEHFGLHREAGKPIDFSGYEAMFGRDPIIEHDHRFTRRDQLANANHRLGSIYGNILDEPLDFIGKFENLAVDMAFVQRRIGFPEPFDLHVEKSNTPERILLDPEDRAWVSANYANDFSSFGYVR
jgi:hypothetical protein